MQCGSTAFISPVRGHQSVVRAPTPAVFDMGAFAACTVHKFLIFMHELPGVRLSKVCHGRAVVNVSHDIFWHAYKAVAGGVYASVWANRKSISHAVYEGADSASACENAFAHMVNIHDFNPAQVFEVLIKKVN